MIARLVRRESRSSGFGDGFGGPGGRWFWNPLSSPLQLPFGAGWFLALVVALWLGRT